MLISSSGGKTSRESTPKSHNGTSSSPKSTTPTVPSVKSQTPPPVTYTEQMSCSSHNSTDSSEKNGLPSRRLSSTSSEIVLNFSSTVDGYSRVSSTGSEVRDRCRDLLFKALMKGLDEGKKLEVLVMSFLCTVEPLYSNSDTSVLRTLWDIPPIITWCI